MQDKKKVGFYAYTPITNEFSNFSMPNPMGVRTESMGFGMPATYKAVKGPEIINFMKGYFETDDKDLISILDKMCIGEPFELPNGRTWERYVNVYFKKEPIIDEKVAKIVTNNVDKFVIPENFVTKMTNSDLKEFIAKAGLNAEPTMTNNDMIALLRDNGNII